MGQIGKPHGISGEVYLVVISDDPARFHPGARLMLDDGTEVVVESVRPHRTRWLLRLEGMGDREAAERLRGRPLYVGSEAARPLETDEYWRHELEGCEVVDADGRRIGQVKAVEEAPAHDLLVVGTARGDRLVPAVKEIVVAIDRAAGRITLDVPEGLLD